MAFFEYLRQIGSAFNLGTDLIKPIGGVCPDDKVSVIRTDCYGNLLISNGDTAASDAFGRHRVSNIVGIWDIQNQYDKNSLFWDEILTGAASAATHNPNKSTISMTTTTASGDSVTRTTRRYFRYRPGRSQFVAMTGIMGAAESGCRKQIGLFDDFNGIFWEQDSSGNLNVVVRSYATGSVVENRISQSNWNINKFDGSGFGGIVLDPTKIQIILIDFQWLGAGRVRIGFDIDGLIVWAHHFKHANIIDSVYMSTANLPLRYKIENVSSLSSTATLQQVCAFIASEGDLDDDIQGINFSADTNGTINVNSSNNLVPLIAIRLKSTFKSITNRGLVRPVDVSVLSGNTDNLRVVLLLNPTFNNAPSYNSADTDSLVEYFVYNGTVSFSSQGKRLKSFYLADQNSVYVFGLFSKFLMSRSVDNTSSDIFVLAVENINGGNAPVAGSIDWLELY